MEIIYFFEYRQGFRNKGAVLPFAFQYNSNEAKRACFAYCKCVYSVLYTCIQRRSHGWVGLEYTLSGKCNVIFVIFIRILQNLYFICPI